MSSKKNRLNLSIKPNDSIQEEDINMEKLSIGEHLPPPEAAAPLFKVLNSFLLFLLYRHSKVRKVHISH